MRTPLISKRDLNLIDRLDHQIKNHKEYLTSENIGLMYYGRFKSRLAKRLARLEDRRAGVIKRVYNQ